jgi:hypothetical protein
MMMTEMDIETSVYYVHLTWLIAREDFIKFTCRESTKTYIEKQFITWYCWISHQEEPCTGNCQGLAGATIQEGKPCPCCNMDISTATGGEDGIGIPTQQEK